MERLGSVWERLESILERLGNVWTPFSLEKWVGQCPRGAHLDYVYGSDGTARVVQHAFAQGAGGLRPLRGDTARPLDIGWNLGHLGATWGCIGRFLGQLGDFLVALCNILGVLEGSWEHLGWNLGHLGRVWEPLGNVLGSSWDVLEGSCGGFGRFWALPR